MAHYPFSGRVNRVAVWAFFERHGLSPALQERYYRWWYDWAREKVMADPDLAAIKGPEFADFPYGQHAHHDFHLHQYAWSTATLDLGQFIEGTLLPKMSEAERHALEEKHHDMLEALKKTAAEAPRPEVPAIGVFRHT